MIGNWSFARCEELDAVVYRKFVPQDHFLRRLRVLIPWYEFEEILAPYYSADMGRPSEPPVAMLKLELLRYLYRLSDRQVIERCRTDIAFRYFLQMTSSIQPPDPTSLTKFRGRLGQEGFRQVFDRLIAIAREQGVVRDRLRLKDATHILSDIAIPTVLALVAQARDKLLAAAEPFDAISVEGERINIELIKEATVGQPDDERLTARVTHLREILAWVDLLPTPTDADDNRPWQKLLQRRELAHKILADREHPQAGDKTRSTVDPEARCSKHGVWYDGYSMDIMMDADSELITQVNVLVGNGEEAVDAVELIRREEAAHGNDIQQLSIDGVGFNGPVLRALQDPDGLAVDVIVPPPAEPQTEIFTPQDFIENAEQTHTTCPNGETSSYRHYDEKRHARVYRFKKTVCLGCPLLAQCMKKPPTGPYGKSIRKTEYEAEHQRARAKATTAEYQATRSEHAKVERKLGEVMNRHGGRRTPYRGRSKVNIHAMMACLATNVKRLTRLLCAPTATSQPQS